MGLNLQSGAGLHIVIEEMPFKVMADFELYRIISPVDLTDCCVKMFNGQNKREHFDAKIEYLCKNRPPAISNNENSIYCWLKDMVLHNNGIVGYIVPSTYDGSISLKELCEEKIKSKFVGPWHENFDRNKPTSLQNRIEICINLCKSLKNIHDQKVLVLIDLNPENIFVTIDGKVSIDCFEGVQITSSGKLKFYGYGSNSDYFPPESKKLYPFSDQINETWDRFSLAIILYKLLIGTHPFSKHNTGQYKQIETISDSIHAGLFAHGSRSESIERNDVSSRYSELHQNIRQLFYQSFETGHTNANVRPTPANWISAFSGDSDFLVPVAPQKVDAEENLRPGEHEEQGYETLQKSEDIVQSNEANNEVLVAEPENLEIKEQKFENENHKDESNKLLKPSSEEIAHRFNNENEENNPDNKKSDKIPDSLSDRNDDKVTKNLHISSDGIHGFITENKSIFNNNVVFETFVKRIWERIENMKNDEYTSIRDIDIQIVETQRGIVTRFLGFSPSDFNVEIKKIQILKNGKITTLNETDDILFDHFGKQYHKLLEKIS